MYILDGDKRAVENVLKENKIRVQRGVISITPTSEFPSPDALAEIYRKHDEEMHDVCSQNDALKQENEALKAELAKLMPETADTKDVVEDSKEVNKEDAKQSSVKDSKDVVADEKSAKAKTDKKKK